MSDLQILLYNKVQLEDGSQGIVRYMGNIMGKKGIFYGVDITKGDAKNDGTFKNIKYFDTKKGTRTGRFCKESKIVKCKKTTFSKYPFKLGDTVTCTKAKCKGTVKYVGVPSWAKGGKVYYGLELQKKKGTCNGTNQGVQYFESKMNYGIYVPFKGVKKVGGKKKKQDSNEDDVKEAMRDYYKSKSKEEVPKSIKKSKSKKKINNNKKKKTNKKTNKPIKSTNSLDPHPMTELHEPTVSVDYMDEEKDGINLKEYQNKTEEMDYEMSEKQRRERNEKMKQMEREERLNRQKEKDQKLKEKQEKEKEKEALKEKQNAEKEQELLKREKELKDKQRLEKYAQAMKEKEEAEKLQKAEQEEIDRKKRENELRKQQEMEAKKAKEEEEKKQRDDEHKLAEKLRKEKEEKLKQQEEKSAQPVVSSGGGGSIKDRMAMFQKQNNNVPKKTVSTPKTESSPKTEQKQQYNSPKVNSNSGVGAPVGADKAINFELQNALGKPLKSVKKTKVADYAGEIPLALYLLGEKLIKIDKFGTFKIFHPEEMQKQADKPEMQCANNIFVFFAKLPEPLLSTVQNNTLMKAINKDVMKDVVSEIDEPYASALTYLWDILAKVAMNPNARMGGQSLGKVFGPMCTMVTQQDVKGNRVSMNALGASRMMAFFRRGIEWRMEVQGYNFEDSDDSD